jgi:hypothetical protein
VAFEPTTPVLERAKTFHAMVMVIVIVMVMVTIVMVTVMMMMMTTMINIINPIIMFYSILFHFRGQVIKIIPLQ